MLHQLGGPGIFSLFSDVKIDVSIHLSHSHLASAMKNISILRHKKPFSFSFSVSLLSAVNSAGLVSLETKICCSAAVLCISSPRLPGGPQLCLGEVVSWARGQSLAQQAPCLATLVSLPIKAWQ